MILRRWCSGTSVCYCKEGLNHSVALMNPLFLSVLLLLCIGHAELEHHEVHFYCRVCGALIANYSSIIEKSPEMADKHGHLDHQEENVVIPYDSFHSSVHSE